MRLTLVAPLHGRAILRLQDGDDELEFPSSYAPEDSLERLVEVADASLTESGERVVILFGGPEQLDLHWRPVSGATESRAVLHVDRCREGSGELVFRAECDSDALARDVWRQMRDIEGAIGPDEYARQWHRPYPDRAVAVLGQRLRGRRR